MLEFMNLRSLNKYYLCARISDCEPNLQSFNYVTPMAVCIEAMVKIMENESNPSVDESELEDMSLAYLLADRNLKKWMKEQYDIDETLIQNVDRSIRKENNTFKHSFIYIPKRNKNEKKERFKYFYDFVSKYYEHHTSNKAPEWSDELFEKLMNPECEAINKRAEQCF